MPIPNPAFATVADWCRISGMSRSGTYEVLGRGDLQARKLGAKILIDVTIGLAWLSSLPPATIKPHGPQHSDPQA